VPVGFLKDAWSAGRVSRLTMLFGLIVSAVWAVLVAVAALRVMDEALHSPALPSAFKVVLSLLITLVALFLVIPLPAQWMMYALLRLEERRRNATGSKP
jgi:hypothetical protein